MTSIDEVLPLLTHIIQGLGRHFGPSCELVIHDYSNNFENTVIEIVNGKVTNRQVGDCATGIGLKIYQGEVISDDRCDGVFNYLSQTKDGRILRSSTIYLRNDEGKLIGSLCVNNDITEMRRAINTISESLNLSEMEKRKSKENAGAVFVGKIDDLLKSMVVDSINQIGVPVGQMNKKHKIAGIRILKEKGAFKIQKAADLVAQYYGISKFTVYNYLNEIECETNLAMERISE